MTCIFVDVLINKLEVKIGRLKMCKKGFDGKFVIYFHCFHVVFFYRASYSENPVNCFVADIFLFISPNHLLQEACSYVSSTNFHLLFLQILLYKMQSTLFCK